MPLKVWEDRMDLGPYVRTFFQVTLPDDILDPPPYMKTYKPHKNRVEKDLKQVKAMSMTEKISWIVHTAAYWPRNLCSVMEALHNEQTVRGQAKMRGVAKAKAVAVP